MKANKTDDPFADAGQRLLALFDEGTLLDRLRRTWQGLHAPHDSGDYKYARLQITRLWSPVSAVVVPALVCVLVLLLSGLRDTTPPTVTLVNYDTPPPPEKPLEPVPQPVDLPRETMPEVPSPAAPDVPTPEINAPGPVMDLALPIAFTPPVKRIKSPIRLRSVYVTRGAGVRSNMRNAGGGEGTGLYVLRALRWLRHHQESDGAWRAESGGKQAGRHATGCTPAMTGLGLLAFLAHGETPTSVEFGLTVERALRWLTANQEADGRFRERDGHDYSLPIAAYALTEGFGMTGTPLVREAAARSITLLIDGQHTGGLWDYNVKPSTRDDLSYSGWCVQALKGAQFADINVAGLDEALKRAARGVAAHAHPAGGYGYTSPGQSHLTCVGVLCQQMLGGAGDRETRLGLKWLEGATCKWSDPWGANPVYYWYYVTQAFFREGGDAWNRWNRAFSTEFCANQLVVKSPEGEDMGYWMSPTEREHCRSLVYNTALCALTLQVYYRTGQGLLTYDVDNQEAPVDFSSIQDIPLTITLEDV